MKRLCHSFILLCLSNHAIAAESWSQFRGPSGDVHTDATNLPLHWTERKNIAWKTATHDRGFSSPVIWGKQIWLTTAAEDGKKLFAVCVDKDNGKVLHDLHLFNVAKPQRITHENTYASPTPVAMSSAMMSVHHARPRARPSNYPPVAFISTPVLASSSPHPTNATTAHINRICFMITSWGCCGLCTSATPFEVQQSEPW